MDGAVLRLLNAAKRGNVAAIRAAVADGAPVDATDEYGEAALALAACEGMVDAVEELLRLGARVGRIGPYGWTALTCACDWASWYWADTAQPEWLGAAMVEMLLAGAANVQYADTDGDSPLLFATRSGDASKVNLLLASGADINHASANGSTALSIACETNPDADPDLFMCLLTAGADVQLVDRHGYSVLLQAAANGKTSIVEMLLEHTVVDVNQVNQNGRSALMLAATHGHVDIVTLLLGNGVDVELVDKDGKTALEVAMSTNADFERNRRQTMIRAAFASWGFEVERLSC